MKKIMKIFAVLFFVLSITGCGTYAARVGDYGYARSEDYFKGVNTDIKILGGQGTAGYTTMFCYVVIVCPFVVLASVPVDLAIDTVLLPYDHVRAPTVRRMTYMQALSATMHGFIKYDFSAVKMPRKDGEVISYSLLYAGGSNFMYLSVYDVPLLHAGAKVVVPYFEGYQPRSIAVYYDGDSYSDVDVGIGLGLDGGSEKGQGDLQVSGVSLVCYESEVDVVERRHKVTMIPYLNGGLQIFLEDTAYGKPSLRC